MIRIAWGLLPLILLVACNHEPGGNAAAVGAPAPDVTRDAGLAQWRADTLRGCIGGARDTVTDPNVPVERHCACAVDREMAGKTLAQLEDDERSGAHEENFPALLRQCIREISPDYHPGQSG
jgi:hypothetical protein